MAMSDISVPSATNTSKGIKVTICASGIKAGDNVYVLHKLKSGSWQTVKPDSVSNGKVTVTLYSFSPVIVVKYSSNVNPTVTTDPSKDENSQGSNTNSNVNDNSNSSSQTNNNNQNNSQTNNQYNPRYVQFRRFDDRKLIHSLCLWPRTVSRPHGGRSMKISSSGLQFQHVGTRSWFRRRDDWFSLDQGIPVAQRRGLCTTNSSATMHPDCPSPVNARRPGDTLRRPNVLRKFLIYVPLRLPP